MLPTHSKQKHRQRDPRNTHTQDRKSSDSRQRPLTGEEQPRLPAECSEILPCKRPACPFCSRRGYGQANLAGQTIDSYFSDPTPPALEQLRRNNQSQSFHGSNVRATAPCLDPNCRCHGASTFPDIASLNISDGPPGLQYCACGDAYCTGYKVEDIAAPLGALAPRRLASSGALKSDGASRDSREYEPSLRRTREHQKRALAKPLEPNPSYRPSATQPIPKRPSGTTRIASVPQASSSSANLPPSPPYYEWDRESDTRNPDPLEGNPGLAGKASGSLYGKAHPSYNIQNPSPNPRPMLQRPRKFRNNDSYWTDLSDHDRFANPAAWPDSAPEEPLNDPLPPLRNNPDHYSQTESSRTITGACNVCERTIHVVLSWDKSGNATYPEVVQCRHCKSVFDFRAESGNYIRRIEYEAFELPDESPQIPPSRPRSCPPDSSRTSSTASSYLDIQFYDSRNDRRNAVVLLDTGCLVGNWISWRKLWELGLEQNVDPSDQPPDMLSACGRKVSCCGAVVLEWRATNIGQRVHKTKFFVMDADHLDAIFGAEFLFKTEAMTFNAHAFAPLTPHKPLRPDELDSMKRRRQEQEQVQSDLRIRREQKEARRIEREEKERRAENIKQM